MTAILAAVSLLLAAGAASILWRSRPRLGERIYGVLLVAGCALGTAAGVAFLVGALEPGSVTSSVAGGEQAFGVDPLSAWFLVVICTVGACAGVFGIGYLRPEQAHRSVAGVHALFATLLAALVGVVTARSVVSFLAAWEVMAISGYLLIMFDHHQAEVRRAGLVYVVLTHLSTLALIGMFAALAGPGSDSSFGQLAVHARTAGTGRTLGLVLALIGFGIKAGAVPLHFWLPGAHAAAPSHVSAILSGVMLKMGVYGLVRIVMLVGSPPAWFGWTLFALGLLSGVLGVLWALGQHDLKRLLAYHSVENIGIIFLGLGLWAIGLVEHRPLVALLGLVGALLHTANHAVFKSLLFLGAGAVQRAAGTRVIDQLGGLARAIPWTAAAFALGSIAIVGLPPLNGFVSEWVVFSGFLTAGTSGGPIRFAVIGAAGLGLIGALALACFTKVIGIVFLGHRRGAHAVAADPAVEMLAPMLLLAAVCVAIGLVPGPVIASARTIALGALDGGGVAPAVAWPVLATHLTMLGLALVATVGIGVFVRRSLASPQRPLIADTWACGAAEVTSRMQYTAVSYAAPIRNAFGRLAGLAVRAERDGLHSAVIDPVDDWVVTPSWRAFERASRVIRRRLGGHLRWYLLAVILTLVALLSRLAAGRGSL